MPEKRKAISMLNAIFVLLCFFEKLYVKKISDKHRKLINASIPLASF